MNSESYPRDIRDQRSAAYLERKNRGMRGICLSVWKSRDVQSIDNGRTEKGRLPILPIEVQIHITCRELLFRFDLCRSESSAQRSREAASHSEGADNCWPVPGVRVSILDSGFYRVNWPDSSPPVSCYSTTIFAPMMASSSTGRAHGTSHWSGAAIVSRLAEIACGAGY